jgi:hypothetical protein
MEQAASCVENSPTFRQTLAVVITMFAETLKNVQHCVRLVDG